MALAAPTTWFLRFQPHFGIVEPVAIIRNVACGPCRLCAFGIVETLVNAEPPHMLCWEHSVPRGPPRPPSLRADKLLSASGTSICATELDIYHLYFFFIIIYF